MPKIYEAPSLPSLFDTEFRRCDACDFPIDMMKGTPSGGRYHAPSEVLRVDSLSGRTFYDLAANDAGQGCPACGSPAWNQGGRLGDLNRPGW